MRLPTFSPFTNLLSTMNGKRAAQRFKDFQSLVVCVCSPLHGWYNIWNPERVYIYLQAHYQWMALFFKYNVINSVREKHPSKVFKLSASSLWTHGCLRPKHSIFILILAGLWISFWLQWKSVVHQMPCVFSSQVNMVCWVGVGEIIIHYSYAI